MTMLFRTTLVLGTVLALLAGLLPAAVPVTAQSLPRLIVETVLSNSANLKMPQAATAGNQVHLAGIAESSGASDGKARVWTKIEGSISFPAPFTLGNTTRTGTNPEYINSAIATSPNGEVFSLWIDQAAKIVRFRKRDTAGNWGPTFEVTRNIVFPIRPTLAVVNGGAQNGRIIAAWRDDEAPGANREGIYYTYSDNGGASWAPVARAFGMKAYRAVVQLASGSNGEVALTFTRDDPRPLHIMVALWTGSGFSAPVDVNLGDGAHYADSSVSIYNGRIYVGYRHTENGIFYAEKPISNLFDNQPWPRARLLSEKGDGQVSVSADAYGNLHFSWIRTPANSGRNQNRLGYAVRLFNGTFLGPIESATAGPLFNAWGVSSSGSGFYMHVAHEQFDGETPFLRYALFQAPGSPFGSAPLIEGGATRVGGDGRTSVKVTFPDLGTTPQNISVRWRWGEPPNDTDPWVLLATNATSATELTVPIPAAFLGVNDCSTRTLYTQLRRNSDNVVETTVRSANVIIDTSVVAQVDVANPLLYESSSWYASNYTVRDLDPGSTPVTQVMLRVADDGDCTGISRVRVAPNSAALAVNSDLDVEGELTAIIPLPGVTFSPPAPDGDYDVVVRVYDKLGNSQTVTKTIRLDRTPPQISLSGSEVITVTDSPLGDILQDLTFDLSSATVTETNGIIGVLIAVSSTAVTNPATSSALKWISAPINFNGGQFTVLSWSMANAPGVTMAMTSAPEQTFYLYIRLIDRAGNIGDTVLQATATSTLTPVRTYIPMTER
ncbi:sialidase family protein [Chloroflexus sp.]|uniref:sialidase family protein n=1 Tax=Chloroflexus sp. TaxID=1904827 RepID=UPI002ACD630A|nr:sialidase family protein [Chloroflexus sp.]